MADRVELQLTGLEGVLETLRSLPAEVVSRRGGVVKSALRKGAVLIFKQEQVLLQQAIAAGTAEPESTGLLAKSMIVTRGKPPADGKGERYLIRFKRAAYDGQKLGKRQKAGKRVTTLQTAQLLEYGSSHQPAQPFIRPAFLTKAEEAIRLVESETVKGVERAAAKLLQQNKGK